MGCSTLVVGGGGREHALAWGLARSPSVDQVETAPGNPGTVGLGPRHEVDPEDPVAVADLAEERGADLVVVGPEGPLVAGVVDELARRGIAAFGPRAAAARIEGSKAFAKDVMRAAGVPTAGHVATGDREEAQTALDHFRPPYVVKADGLAAGKGVLICPTLDEARSAVDDVLVRRAFGEAGDRLIIEEYLEGPERSVFAVCDGEDAVLLSPAQDYKRARDGDDGPNTGGMGAFTPVPGFGLRDVADLEKSIFVPVLGELAGRGCAFRGLLYAGLIETPDGLRVLEFNARFGDPETQVVVPRLSSDLGELLLAAATGSVRDVEVAWHDEAVVTVVLASGGYPGSYEKGAAISGVGAAGARTGVEVFHAGTTTDDGGPLVTAGGRVLDVTARGPSVGDARAAAYAAVGDIEFEGMQLRTDIAAGV